MLKIKLFSILSVLGLVGIVCLSSREFPSEARGDVLKEIAGYKTWKKLVKPDAKPDINTFTISDSSIAG
jgi:hypothetical protein